MCAGDDRNCPDFELHRQKLLDELDAERRSFLKSAFVATGGATVWAVAGATSDMPPAVSAAAPPVATNALFRKLRRSASSSSSSFWR